MISYDSITRVFSVDGKPADMWSGGFRMDYEGQDEKTRAALWTVHTDGSKRQPGPLTFHTREGVWIRPATIVPACDLGSVPNGVCQGLADPKAWARSYVCHDSDFYNHGWWEQRADGQPWVFVRQTQHAVDHMLERRCLADGATMREAYRIFCGPKLAGSKLWRNHKGPFPTDQFVQ